MQYSIVTAISTVLIASTLTSAAVIPRQSSTDVATDISIQLKTGDGDASVGRDVVKDDFGFLLTQDSNGQDFNGVALRTTSAGFECGVFDPKTGTSLNGLVFTSTSDDAVFGKNGSAGETDSDGSDAIAVAICCDVEASFASTCANPKPKSNQGGSTSSSTTVSSTTASATVSATASATASANQANLSVDMQLSGLSELSVPATIIANGKPKPVRNAVGIQNIHIKKQHAPVECTAFADLAGKHQVGNFFDVKKTGVDFTDFDFQAGVDVNAVSCKIIA